MPLTNVTRGDQGRTAVEERGSPSPRLEVFIYLGVTLFYLLKIIIKCSMLWMKRYFRDENLYLLFDVLLQQFLPSLSNCRCWIHCPETNLSFTCSPPSCTESPRSSSRHMFSTRQNT